ncbi:MAG: hypothetical protein CMQ05_06900 [Gammaproteobacteria bacterium]|nr:hypothetical protein [Gammaproteobacteria bacterium]RPG26441.1 MAG: hypothetical protein CBC10_004800 [Gammaproteobacteria bacterium TMED50]|tara:strand:- start:3196 stop:3939 length:744 start_codon:yes stop_codon:yes gene_type:complete
MDTVKQAVADIDSNGFSIVRELIAGERLAKLDKDAEALLVTWNAKSIDGGTVSGRMHKGTFGVSRAFDDVIVHPLLLSIVQGVLDPTKAGMHEEAMLAHIASRPNPDNNIKCNIMVKDAVPREDVRSLHRDVRIPVPRPHRPVVCNTLLAIDPFTIENGATCVIPGSHRFPSDEVPESETVPVEMEPGDIVIFDGELWHGHIPNLSHVRYRRCLNLNYHYRWLGNFPNPKLPDEVWRELPEPLRAVV